MRPQSNLWRGKGRKRKRRFLGVSRNYYIRTRERHGAFTGRELEKLPLAGRRDWNGRRITALPAWPRHETPPRGGPTDRERRGRIIIPAVCVHGDRRPKKKTRLWSSHSSSPFFPSPSLARSLNIESGKRKVIIGPGVGFDEERLYKGGLFLCMFRPSSNPSSERK